MKGKGSAPCYGCDERHYKCHAECEAYKKIC